MAENPRSQQPAEVVAEARTRIRIRRLDKVETTGNVASNSSGN
ncbi:hypothetical protein [Streptosporangium carneum]|uniref:Uncharacterized protein n=1 Tax=Streptosporangium carneum TaxID=47481 RepID=A0A9W6I959_9ACTN|nr:hypothetical protein [Streptosporangium carneum]GLK13454.1 hypothetical protein GCM10017600_68650 [Streptosporangium carneum]